MIFRLKDSELIKIKTLLDLDRAILCTSIKCPICSFYKRLSSSSLILKAALHTHIIAEHPDADVNDIIKNIEYEMIAIPLDEYYKLSELVIIDP